MIIVNGFPPNIEKIRAAFPVRRNTVYTYGDSIYAPGYDSLSKDLIEHERVHCAQQGSDIEGWWDRYIADRDFRLSQEVEAYRKQYQAFKSSCGGSKTKCFQLLKYIATDLSGPMYGNLVGIFEAMRLIQS